MISLNKLTVHLSQLHPLLGTRLIPQAQPKGLVVICHHSLHAILQGSRCVHQLISMWIDDQRHDTDQEAVWSMSNSYYHSFRPLVHVLHLEALLYRSRSEIPIVSLYILQQVIREMSFVRNALVAQFMRIQADCNVSESMRLQG